MEQKLESRQSQISQGATAQIRADLDRQKSIRLNQSTERLLVLVETL